jgi:Flp pilus assembly protein TadG
MFTYKMSLLRRQRPRTKGAAIVEMVVTLPIFLTFLFYIIQYGYTVNAFVTLSNIARESARYAAVHGTETNACASVKSYGETTVAQNGQMTVTVTPQYLNGTTWTDLTPCATSNWGAVGKVPARVKVAYDFSKRNLHLPFVWLPTTLNSSQNAYAVMYVEPQQ